MAISKVISFLSGSDRREGSPERLSEASLAEDAAIRGGRIRMAMRDNVPSESLMSQLRDIIVGPQTRLNEARFEELLDILEEQKDSACARLDAVEQHLTDTTENATRMTSLLEGQNGEIADLKVRLEEQMRVFRAEQQGILDELRTGFEQKLEILSDVLGKRIHEFEMDLRSEYLNLSSSFVLHIAEEDKRWTAERDNSLSTLEQRIKQWRAELEDERRQDMERLGTSMMDIGKRLMALQQS